MSFIETQSGALFYEVCDLTPPWNPAPETIIFHHGIAANTDMWANWVPVLAQQFRLVRFDMRGFGQSTVPPSDFLWSFDGLTDDLMQIANAVDAKRFHLVGESIGGTVAMAFALRAPERLLSLCLSNAAARGGLVGNVVGWKEEVEKFGQSGWAERMMQRRFHADALDPKVYAWYREVHETCSMSATLGLANLLLNTDLSTRLGEIKTSTLLLSPDDSPFIPAQVMAAMHAQIPNAQLQVFAHSKHGLPLSHGEQCAHALLDFINRNAAVAP